MHLPLDRACACRVCWGRASARAPLFSRIPPAEAGAKKKQARPRGTKKINKKKRLLALIASLYEPIPGTR